jgi:hypothetical protein
MDFDRCADYRAREWIIFLNNPWWLLFSLRNDLSQVLRPLSVMNSEAIVL